MKVFVPKSSNVAKILSTTLMTLVFSLNVHALHDQGQAQEKGKIEKVEKVGKAEKGPSQVQTKDCDQALSQAQAKGTSQAQSGQTSQAQTKDCGQAPSQAQSSHTSQAQTKDCGQGQSQAQAKDCGQAPTQKGPSQAQSSSQSQVSSKGKDDCHTEPAPCAPAAPIRGATIKQADCNTCDQISFVNQVTTTRKASSMHVCGKHGSKINKIKGNAWGQTQWTNLYLSNVYLDNVDSRNAYIDNVWFDGSARDWNLDGAHVHNSTFANGTFQNVDNEGGVYQNVLFKNMTFQRKHGKHSNFDKTTLRDVDFVGCQLGGMTFRGAYLDNVNIECSQIKDVDQFNGANVRVGEEWVKLEGDSFFHVKSFLSSCHQDNSTNTSSWLRSFRQH
jgi:uncharacterized protein YjbI with pentapeptide repeats